MSYLIAGVIMIALVAILTLFMGKNGGGSTKDKKTSNRNKAQIIKEANKKLEFAKIETKKVEAKRKELEKNKQELEKKKISLKKN